MRCETCRSPLARPGDYCLQCREPNADAIVLTIDETEATLTFFSGKERRGETTIPTVPETAERNREVQERNFLSRIADEIYRKRPESIYVTGERDLMSRLRRYVTAEWYRIDGDDPIATYQDRFDRASLEIVDKLPREKLGGRHTSIIGGRRGKRILRLLGEHPHVKKIIPGPIEAGGVGSQQGFRAKATRATSRGNIRVLLHDGSSVQEIRIVTTASNHTDGERICTQLNERLTETGYQPE